MTKTAAQLDREIAEALDKSKKKPRTPRVLPSPKATGETTVSVPSPTGTGHLYAYRLRPAEMRTIYETYGHGSELIVKPAKRTDDTWLVLTKSGMYVGVLQEGSSYGDEPWCVYKLDRQTSAIAVAGEKVSKNIRCAATWQEAVAKGWWNT